MLSVKPTQRDHHAAWRCPLSVFSLGELDVAGLLSFGGADDSAADGGEVGGEGEPGDLRAEALDVRCAGLDGDVEAGLRHIGGGGGEGPVVVLVEVETLEKQEHGGFRGKRLRELNMLRHPRGRERLFGRRVILRVKDADLVFRVVGDLDPGDGGGGELAVAPGVGVDLEGVLADVVEGGGDADILLAAHAEGADAVGEFGRDLVGGVEFDLERVDIVWRDFLLEVVGGEEAGVVGLFGVNGACCR